MCKSLEIVTRASSSTVTYIKHFLPCNEEKVAESDVKRPSHGTTVTVLDFMFNMPVRRDRIKVAVELELMRSYIELIALAHPEISISLRDDAKRHITLEKRKSSGLLDAFGHLFGHSVARSLAPISFSNKKFKLSGYISTEAYRHNDLQFIYINKRPAVKTKLHKFVNFLLSKSAIIKNETWKTKPIPKAVPVEKWILNPPPGKLKKCAVFVMNIECARKEYGLLWDIKKPLLYFEDWPGILASINDAVQTFLKQENLLGITNKEKCLQGTGHNEDGQNCRTFKVSHQEDTNSVNSKETLLKETKFSKLEVETWDLQGAVHGICVKRPKNKMQFKKTEEYNLKIKKKYTSEDSLNNTNMKEHDLKEKGIIPFDLNIQMLSDKSRKEAEVSFEVSKKMEEREEFTPMGNTAGSYITPLPQAHDVNTSSREMNSVPPVVKFLKIHETPQYAKLQITKAAYHWKKMEEEAMLEMAKENSGSVDQGNKLHLTAFMEHHKKGKKIHTEVSFLMNTEQSGEITKVTHGSEVNDQTRKPMGKRKLDNLKSYYEPKFKKCKDFGNEELSFSPSKEKTMKKEYCKVIPDKPEKKPISVSFRETHSPLLDHHKSSSILCGNEYHNLFCGTNFVENKENNVNQSSSNYLKKKTSSSIVCFADDEVPFDDKYGCQSIISFETKINKSSYEGNDTEGANLFQHLKNSIEEAIEFPCPKNNNFPPFVKEKCCIDNSNITNRTEESTMINLKKLVSCSKSKSSKLNLDFSKMITVSIPTPHSDLVTIHSKSFSPLVKESKNLPNNVMCAADNLETCQPFLNASSFNSMTSIKNADPHPSNSNEILLFHDFKEENSPVQSHVQKEIHCKFSNFAVQTPSHFPTTILDGAEENNNLNISKNQRNNNSLIKFTLGEINNTFDFTNENNPFKIFDLSEAAIKPGNSGEYKSPYFKRQRRHFKGNEHNSDDKRTTEVENKKEWKIQNCCSTNDKRSYSNERIKEKFLQFVPPTGMDETRPKIISGIVVPTSDPKIVPESLDLISRKKVCAMSSSTNSALPLLKSCSPKQNIVSCLDQTDSNILKKHSKDSNTTNILFTSESNEINEIMTLEPNSPPRIVDSTLRNEKLCVTKEELFVDHSKQSCNTSKSFLIKDICHILDKSANKEKDTNPVSPYFVVKNITNGTNSLKLPDCMSHSNNYDINNKERTDAAGSKANETQNNINVSRYVTPKSHKNNLVFSFLGSDKIPKDENDTKFSCFEFNNERQSFEEQLSNIAHTSKCSSVSPRTTEKSNFETNISKCQVVVQNKDSSFQVHKNVTSINDTVQNDISNECGPDFQINMLPHDKNLNTVTQGDKLLENKTDISKECVEGDNFVSENLKGSFPCELTSYASLMVPKDPSIYTMSSRLSFLPKGMSPLLSVPSNVLWKHSKLKADVKVNKSKETSESSVGSVCQDNSSSLKEKRDVSDILSVIKLLPDKRTLSSNTQIPDLSIILAKTCHALQQDRYDKRLFKHLQVIGQLDKKFIVTMCSLQKNSTPHVLALFDQHAVHERIRLETLMKEYTSHENNWSFKSTAIPEKILLLVGSKEFRILSSYQEKFQKLGLHFQILDKDTISVFKIPTCLYSRFLRERSKQWLEETLHILIQDVVRYFIVTNGHDSLVPEVYKDVINSEACKGAIKFGDALSKHQCEELLFFLSKCDLPFFCAHGRPTFKPILDLREFEAERKKYVDVY